MAVRKNNVSKARETKNTENIVNNTNPLVFISHDTRDAELAEEFSNLLKSASAGALKSFRSSDKKGTQGIEYGQEWYPAIMDKIDEASDIVCLLTKHSVDRPWILYEAGVAKGKLDKKVIGIALGIPFSSAITGPFALFQNNDGDVDSVTKLVLELVRKVPGLDPDSALVKQLVENFIKKAIEITEKYSENSESDNASETDSSSVAKLFEEVKIMFDSLPGRIENRIDPEIKRRKRRFHPIVLDEIMHSGVLIEDNYMGFLILLSFFKEDFPWFFEIGMETYRNLKNAKNASEREKIIVSFERATELLNHPIMKDFHNDKDMYFLLRESKHFFHRFLDRFYLEKAKE